MHTYTSSTENTAQHQIERYIQALRAQAQDVFRALQTHRLSNEEFERLASGVGECHLEVAHAFSENEETSKSEVRSM